MPDIHPWLIIFFFSHLKNYSKCSPHLWPHKKDGWSWFGIYLPNKNTNIILGISVGRHRGDTCTHCYFAVDLNEPWAQQIVATRRLICITLQNFWSKDTSHCHSAADYKELKTDNKRRKLRAPYSPISKQPRVVVTIKVWAHLIDITCVFTWDSTVKQIISILIIYQFYHSKSFIN